MCSIMFRWGISFGKEKDLSLEPALFRLTHNYSFSKSQLQNKGAIVSTYCKLALSSHDAQGPLSYVISADADTLGINFTLQDSLFVRALCNARDTSLVPEDMKDQIFIKDFHKKLSLQQYYDMEDECSMPSRNRCDMSRYVSIIYTSLMSDIFKIKRAHFLQVYSVDKFSEKSERIANIFATYFRMKETNASDYQHKYPKTSSMIDNNQSFFLKSLSSLVMLDNDVLYQTAEEENCMLSDPVGWFVCALHSTGDGVNQHFTNFVYHEYLNYRIFLDYYTNQLQKLISSSSDSEAERKDAYFLEMETLIRQRDLYEQALLASLSDFQDFVTTYPLHVGLVLYQEELLRFRDKYAAKILPPFYSLYQKLRNVQPVQ